MTASERPPPDCAVTLAGRNSPRFPTKVSFRNSHRSGWTAAKSSSKLTCDADHPSDSDAVA